MFDKEKHRRRSIRLKDYDYARNGAYFVTVCAYNHQCLFGEIVNGKMQLKDFGQIVYEEWLRTDKLRPNVVLDVFVVMPNHFHAILIIDSRGVLPYAPPPPQISVPPHKPLAQSCVDSNPQSPNKSTKCATPLVWRYGSVIITNTSSTTSMNET